MVLCVHKLLHKHCLVCNILKLKLFIKVIYFPLQLAHTWWEVCWDCKNMRFLIKLQLIHIFIYIMMICDFLFYSINFILLPSFIWRWFCFLAFASGSLFQVAWYLLTQFCVGALLTLLGLWHRHLSCLAPSWLPSFPTQALPLCWGPPHSVPICS